jgi:hypothetical protein
LEKENPAEQREVKEQLAAQPDFLIELFGYKSGFFSSLRL